MNISPKCDYETQNRPVLQCSQGLAASGAGGAVKAQNNQPRAGRSEWREYWRVLRRGRGVQRLSGTAGPAKARTCVASVAHPGTVSLGRIDRPAMLSQS